MPTFRTHFRHQSFRNSENFVNLLITSKKIKIKTEVGRSTSRVTAFQFWKHYSNEHKLSFKGGGEKGMPVPSKWASA